MIESPDSNNCLQMCIAYMFSCKPIEVPHVFRVYSEDFMWMDWQWQEIRDFATARGLVASYMYNDEHPEEIKKLDSDGCMYVSFVKVPGKVYGHCLVKASGELLYDPQGGHNTYGDEYMRIFFIGSEESTDLEKVA